MLTLHSKCLSALHISLFTVKHHEVLMHEETNTPWDCHLSLVQGQSGSSRTGFVQDLANLIPKSLCSHTHHIMLLPTLPNGNINRHSWTNKSKWVTSKDVALGRFCSYSSDAAIIRNIATAKRNNLRELFICNWKYLQNLHLWHEISLTGIKACHLHIDLIFWQPKIRKS